MTEEQGPLEPEPQQEQEQEPGLQPEAQPQETPEKPQPEVKAAETPQQTPGTPDKVLQRLQQDTAAALRKIAELEARQAPLTQAEEKQLAKARSKLEEVKRKLGEQYDVFDPEAGRLAAEATVEVGDKIESLAAKVEELERRTREQAAQRAWDLAQAKYPGLDVRKVFAECVRQAQVDLYGDPDALEKIREESAMIAVQNYATRLLDSKARAIQKPGAARAPIKPVPATNATPAPENTAGTAPRRDYSVLLKTDADG